MKRRILIVDDEASLLSLLALIFDSTDPNWDVATCSHPAEAIEKVRDFQPDLLLTDQTMPGMSGCQLLSQIGEIAPQTVRILISGHMRDPDRLAVAHQYLAKPFDAGQLTRMVRQALDAQERLREPALCKLVSSFSAFPALPHKKAELLSQLTDNDDYVAMARTASEDGAIASKLLQLANSPLFRGQSTITDIQDAFLQLGIRHVKALLLSIHVFHKFNSAAFGEISPSALWHHSSQVAEHVVRFCRRARLSAADVEAGHFAGLFHDLGRLILMENEPETYREICHTARLQERPIHEVELEILGATHADVAAFMLQLWGMEKSTVDAVAHHYRPWEGPNPDRFTPTTALYLAHLKETSDEFVHPAINFDYLSEIGVEADEWETGVDCGTAVA